MTEGTLYLAPPPLHSQPGSELCPCVPHLPRPCTLETSILQAGRCGKDPEGVCPQPLGLPAQGSSPVSVLGLGVPLLLPPYPADVGGSTGPHPPLPQPGTAGEVLAGLLCCLSGSLACFHDTCEHHDVHVLCAPRHKGFPSRAAPSIPGPALY